MRKLSLVLTVALLLVGGALPLQAQDEDLTEVSVVLQWVTQAQFAGYYAAAELGFYEELGLSVEIRPGGPDINPDQLVAAGQVDFGVRPFVNTLAARENGADLVSLARVNQVVPTLVVSFAEDEITEPEDLEGRVVGSWLGGNETALFALMRQAGVEPDTDAEIVRQGFDMTQLLNREIEAAQATIYNEYAQVLETINPDTGELYTPEDFSIIRVSDYGITTLQDNIFTTETLLESEGGEETALAFVQASLKGWIHCRDNPDECVQIVLDQGSALGESHQQWMMNEFNALLWPAPNGIGILNDENAFEETVAIALEYELITEEPDEGTWRTDIVETAVANLEAEGLDVYGLDFEKTEVELREGGQ
jgi:NitT/TauT family transport system substrate-binding protein